jgi:hypothetical protein
MERAMKAGILFIPLFDAMIVKTSQVRQLQDIFRSVMVARKIERVVVVR